MLSNVSVDDAFIYYFEKMLLELCSGPRRETSVLKYANEPELKQL